MKSIIKTSLLSFSLLLASIILHAQEEKPVAAKWVSKKGYWVIENNINDPLNHIIRFYNNDNTLLYKEKLSGVKLNPNKRSVKMKLKKVLEANIESWQQQRETEENKSYVMVVIQ